MLDPWTCLSLALQLCVLCSIAVALLLYLLKKVKQPDDESLVNQSKTILVTSVDTALGLQIATLLSSRGWRVIAGCKPGGLGERLVTSWVTSQSITSDGEKDGKLPPKLVTIELDVTRDDLLEEAVRSTTQHLPSGETGLWAIINTVGVYDTRGAEGWETMIRVNVLGSLRLARMFSTLLTGKSKNKPGTLFYIGTTSECVQLEKERPSECNVGFVCSRACISSAAKALSAHLKPVNVTALHLPYISGKELYAAPGRADDSTSRPSSPSWSSNTSTIESSVCVCVCAEYVAAPLDGKTANKLVEILLSTNKPTTDYQLQGNLWHKIF